VAAPAVRLATPVAPDAAPAARGVERTVLGCLAVVVVASTVLHHAAPAVLAVPPDDGVPRSGWLWLVAADAGAVALAWLCFRHARATLGPYGATMFLAGSFAFTGLEETLWILWGRFDPRLGGTYYFTKGFAWFLETPVSACLGWFFLAWASVTVAGVLVPRAGGVVRAALGGLLATDLDLWIDPVQTSAAHRSWVWLAPTPVRVLSIPLTNFVGWFLLVFCFALLMDALPGRVARHGPARAAWWLFGALLALEAAILAGFVVLTRALAAVVPAPVNLTVLGI